jgi:acetyltransferase-like isoleucine patch superfamily enzyme
VNGLLAPVAARGFRSVRRRLRQRDKRRALASGRLEMGRLSYGAPIIRGYAGDTSRVVIGSFVSIAEEVEFIPGANHYTARVTTFPPYLVTPSAPYEPGDTKGDIHVGHDVWLGRAATILSGVTIGNGAVVGTRAVVAGDVRPYAVVVGNPAREVRRRFTDEQIAQLERIAWWDWPLELIRARADLLFSERVDDFIAAFR